MITLDDFKKVEVRAGKVLSAEKVGGSEKLLKLLVDFGEENERQVISGIAKFVNPENLTDQVCIFVTNLEPREIMGLKSEAMIMALSGENFFSLLKVESGVPLGSIVK